MRRMAIGACEDLMSAMQDAPHDEEPVTHIKPMEAQFFEDVARLDRQGQSSGILEGDAKC